MAKHCANCKYEKLGSHQSPCRECTLRSRWEAKSEMIISDDGMEFKVDGETVASFTNSVYTVSNKPLSLSDIVEKRIEELKKEKEMNNFKVTNVSVDCGLNVVPVAEITVEGSLADVTPRGIDRVVKTIENALNNRRSGSIYMPVISKVIHNNPATIVFWEDGTKTVVKCQDGDIYDPEKGLAMAISKKALGNQGNYCEVFKKWLPEEVEEVEGEFTFDFTKVGEAVRNAVEVLNSCGISTNKVTGDNK